MKKLFPKGKKFLTLVLLFLAWRIWLQVFLSLGWFALPLGENFLGGGLKHFLEYPGLWAWSNFDGEHYLSIAHHGYGNFEQAFFPLFPLLIRFLAFPFKDDLFYLLLSGLTISHVFFFASILAFFFLVKLDFGKGTPIWAIIFLLAFPTSFFFAAIYSEALFFFLVVSSFYFARKGRWWAAGILGMFATATRFTGIFLLPALLWEWREQKKINPPAGGEKIKMKNLFNLLPIFLISAGLLWYMRFLSINYNDPLMFIHSQPVFGAQREVDKLILPYQVLWRYLKMISGTQFTPLYFTVWLELTTSIGFFGLLIFAYLKKVRRSYLAFAFASYLLPTLTGTLLSMPRFLLVLFPAFIALALIKNVFLKALILGVSFILLIMSTILFTQGYFVS